MTDPAPRRPASPAADRRDSGGESRSGAVLSPTAVAGARVPGALIPASGPVLRAAATLLLGVLLLSLMGALVKMLLTRFGASELSAWRNLLGLIPTFLILWSSSDWRARGRPSPASTAALQRGREMRGEVGSGVRECVPVARGDQT